ncbi:MAG TPA: ATP-binding cassette domain-containing protein [Chloroflexota bacterium]
MEQSIDQPVLQAEDISKAFGHVQALRGVDLDLYPAEVLGLVGDNGAGKSTLIKILSGAMQPDTGRILVNGRVVQLTNPVVARQLGIETVYQDLAVVPMLDIAENLFLGREERQPGPLGLMRFLNKRDMRRRAAEQLRTLNIGIKSVRQNVETLSGGQRQGVAVGRALTFGRHIVIMDEPTAALGVRESRGVVDLIKRIHERGLSVILISHNMPQVLEVTDRIMVLRHGARVGVVRTADTNVEQVVRLITGAEVLRDPAA